LQNQRHWAYLPPCENPSRDIGRNLQVTHKQWYFKHVSCSVIVSISSTSWTRNRIEASVRLLCPKCDAEYEIPDDVIPTEGRDVQCSGCQETWFVPANTPPPERTTIDPKVSSILQQEVQREMEARKAEKRVAHDTELEQAPATRGLDRPPPPVTAAYRAAPTTNGPRRPLRICHRLIRSKFPHSLAQLTIQRA
jgi:predicted Zn finger-like uncharacterized protein